MMRIFMLCVITVFAFITAPCKAEEGAAFQVTGTFQQSLIDLKQSVDNLNKDNIQLTQENEALRVRLNQLRLQLGGIQKERETLDKEGLKLKVVNEVKAKQINDLRQQVSLLNERSEKVGAEIGLMGQRFEQKLKEDEELLKQIAEMTPVLQPKPVIESKVVETKPDPRKEKLKLMKMVYDSKQNQAKLHDEILGLQKERISSGMAQSLARKAFLQARIKEAEDALVQMPLAKPSIKEDLDLGDQIAPMEKQLKDLQKNHDQLAVLVDQLQQKNFQRQIKPEQRQEQNKLMDNLNDLRHQGEVLKADLKDLRNDMVGLDKRKLQLESMLR